MTSLISPIGETFSYKKPVQIVTFLWTDFFKIALAIINQLELDYKHYPYRNFKIVTRL